MRKVYSLLRKCVKWRVVPLIFMAVQSNAFAAAQDSSNVSLNFTNQPIENVFIALEKQTGYTVFFSGSTLDGNSRVSVNVSQVSLSNALTAVLRGRNITWTIKHKGIVLSKKPAAVETPASQPVNAAVRDTVPLIDVAGVVVDVKGNPIPAATVSIKGYPRGQGTDNLGRFSFTKVPGNATLVFSSLGYDPKQIKIAGRNEIRVALDSAIREIQAVEVVSTGYQDIPKERATGSFVQLDNKLLSRTPSTNILDRINYVTSSLRYDEGNAKGTRYIIRGFSTINANKQPLIVIDGFPYEEYPLSGLVERLNPNDVESITILRDAAAASIWGARSGNGVIVITTKKGRYNSKPEINFTTNLTLTEKPRLYDIPSLSSEEAIEFERARFNTGYYNQFDDLYPSIKYFPIVSPAIEALLARRRNELSPSELEGILSDYSKHNVLSDINKYFVQNAFNQQYNVNVRGGNTKSNFFTSFGYDKVKGDTKKNLSERFSARILSSQKISDFVETTYFIDYIHGNSSTPRITYNQLVPSIGNNQVAPYSRLINAEGHSLAIPKSAGIRQKYLDTVNARGLTDWNYKPIDELTAGHIKSKIDNIRLGGNIKIAFLKNFNVELKGQYNKTNTTYENYFTENSFQNRDMMNKFVLEDPTGKLIFPYPKGGLLQLENSTQTSWNIRSQLNYSQRWNNHSIDALIGMEGSETKFDNASSSLFGYNKETLTSVPMNFNTPYPTRPTGGQQYINSSTGTKGILKRFSNYYGNFSYVYASKYAITGSARIDATNILGIKANLRKVPLWSVGMSWNIANETFLRNSAIDRLNLRVTYGWNGNIDNSVSTLPTITYSTPTNPYTQSSYAFVATPPNPDLTWEKVKTFNTGIDFGFWRNRLYGAVDIYIKNGVDLIGPIYTEATKGILQYTGNYASICGRGLDIQLNSELIRSARFNWLTSINFSTNTEKVINYILANPNDENVATNYLVSGFVRKGQPLSQIYAYKWAGLDPKNGDPRGYLADTIASYREIMRRGNAKPEDLVHFGSSIPRITGNILNSFTFNRIAVSINITYRFKYFFRRSSINYSNLLTYWAGHSDFTNRWKKPGDENITTVPSQILSSNQARDTYYAMSSTLVEKGDNLKLQDIRIEYSIPFSIPNLPILSNISVNAMASNLGIIWSANDQHLDPENQLLPPSKSYTVGISLKL